MNILNKPCTNEQYAEFAAKANEAGQRIEIINGTAYRLFKYEIVQDGKIADISGTSKYKKAKEQEEKERLGMLSMTKRDFVIALKAHGVTYAQVKTLLASNEDAQMEWELCERLYRGNPYLDQLCSVLGVMPAQLDEIFDKSENP